MTQPGRPAVFVHGLWLHTSSWGPWLELFQEAGYAPTAPGAPRPARGRPGRALDGNRRGHPVSGHPRLGPGGQGRAGLPDPPFLLQAPDNPEGVPQGLFDGFVQAAMADAPAWMKGFLDNFYNFDTLRGTLVSDQAWQASWNLAVTALATAAVACIGTWASDFRADLPEIAGLVVVRPTEPAWPGTSTSGQVGGPHARHRLTAGFGPDPGGGLAIEQCHQVAAGPGRAVLDVPAEQLGVEGTGSLRVIDLTVHPARNTCGPRSVASRHESPLEVSSQTGAARIAHHTAPTPRHGTRTEPRRGRNQHRHNPASRSLACGAYHPMTVLATGDARCSWPASRNTRERAAVKLRKLRDQADTPVAQRDRPGRQPQRCRCPGQNRVCPDAARSQRRT